MENQQNNTEIISLIKKQNNLIKTLIIFNVLIVFLVGFFCLKVSSISTSFENISTKIEELNIENINSSVEQIGSSLEIVNNSLQPLNKISETLTETLNKLTDSTNLFGNFMNFSNPNQNEDSSNNSEIDDTEKTEAYTENDLLNMIENTNTANTTSENIEEEISDIPTDLNSLFDMFSGFLGGI